MIFDDGIIETNYGLKREGKSFFLIIAPHAAGDDLKTALISAQLAKSLNGFLLINNKYFKKNNHRSIDQPDLIADFNKLTWSYRQYKYLWQRKTPALKTFFADIGLYCKQARTYHPEQKAVAIYIHGMKDKKTGIDIGVGLKTIRGNNKFINSAKAQNKNSGLITIKISQLKKIKSILQKALEKDYQLKVSVGKKHIGWSKQSAIQWHKHEGRDDYALQLEINSSLRKPINREYLINLITLALTKTF